MTQFIIHVGPHKTGTSYLQECFVAARLKLAERGIHYPAIWGRKAHYGLFDGLAQVPNPNLEADFAGLHAAAHARVLISVEGLVALQESTVEYLHRLIGPEHSVSVVFYVRSWADLLPSHWKEIVKGGDVMTMPEYLYTRLHNPNGSAFVNFAMGLRPWVKLFGREAIRLIAYDEVVASRQDLFAHFAEKILDWPSPPELGVPRANVSPSPADIEAMRTLAVLERMRLGRELPKPYAQALYDRYMQRRSTLVSKRTRRAMEEHADALTINESLAAMMDLHRKLFDEFGHALVSPHRNKLFFDARRVQVPYVRADWLMAPGVFDEVRVLQETLRIEVGPPERYCAA